MEDDAVCVVAVVSRGFTEAAPANLIIYSLEQLPPANITNKMRAYGRRVNSEYTTGQAISIEKMCSRIELQTHHAGRAFDSPATLTFNLLISCQCMRRACHGLFIGLSTDIGADCSSRFYRATLC